MKAYASSHRELLVPIAIIICLSAAFWFALDSLKPRSYHRELSPTDLLPIVQKVFELARKENLDEDTKKQIAEHLETLEEKQILLYRDVGRLLNEIAYITTGKSFLESDEQIQKEIVRMNMLPNQLPNSTAAAKEN